MTLDLDDDEGKFVVRAGVYPVDFRKRKESLHQELDASCDVYTITNMSSLARTEVPFGRSIQSCGFVAHTAKPRDQFLQQQQPSRISKPHRRLLSDTTVWSMGHDGENDSDDDGDDDVDDIDNDDDDDEDGKSSLGKQSYLGYCREICRILKHEKQPARLLSLSDVSSIGEMPGCIEQDSKSESEEQGVLQSVFLHSTYSYPLHSTMRLAEDVTPGNHPLDFFD